MRSLISILRAITCGLLIVCSEPRCEEVLAIVVNPNSDVATLSKSDAINIFLGRYRKFPTGLTAIPIDTISHKDQFYAALVNKTSAEIGAYWARLKFSGQTMPPHQASLAEVIDLIARTPGAIGYVPANRVDAKLKTLMLVTP